MSELKPQKGMTDNGASLHYSVGAIIARDGKFLLIDRKNPPLGYAALAGHIDEGEDKEVALRREVKEESGLTVTGCKLIGEGRYDGVTCVLEEQNHYWYVYECEALGDVVLDDDEEHSIGWYTLDEIKKLPLEPSWLYWFKKLSLI